MKISTDINIHINCFSKLIKFSLWYFCRIRSFTGKGFKLKLINKIESMEASYSIRIDELVCEINSTIVNPQPFHYSNSFALSILHDTNPTKLKD